MDFDSLTAVSDEMPGLFIDGTGQGGRDMSAPGNLGNA